LPSSGRRLAVSGRVWQPAAMAMGRTSRGAALVTAAVLAGGACAAAVLGALASPGYAAASDSALLFHYADPQIDESSGLAASSYSDGIVYTFNDSGDTARFFAVNSSGATAAIYTLKGATNHDWEDMDTGTDATGQPVTSVTTLPTAPRSTCTKCPSRGDRVRMCRGFGTGSSTPTARTTPRP
jgi:hypothetical protein